VNQKLMRRRILTILLAALVVAVVVPLGAALTLDRRLPLSSRGFAHVAGPAPSAPHRDAGPWPEAGSLALAGGVLIGLAAAVRRVG
jgi:hypothetical protein